MILFITLTAVVYVIIGLCVAMAAFDAGHDDPLRLGVFWFPLFVKWFLKTLWSVLVDGWFAK